MGFIRDHVSSNEVEVDCRASAGKPGKGAEVKRAKKRPVGDLRWGKLELENFSFKPWNFLMI